MRTKGGKRRGPIVSTYSGEPIVTIGGETMTTAAVTSAAKAVFGAKYTGTTGTNPKDAIGSSKLPLHLWPPSATAVGCLGFLDGMLKYGRSNWRASPVLASIYVAALKRHSDAYYEGQTNDPDTGIPHLAGVLASAAILVDAAAAGTLVDDRQYPGGYQKLVAELTPHVARLRELRAGKNPRHYTIADVKEDGVGTR